MTRRGLKRKAARRRGRMPDWVSYGMIAGAVIIAIGFFFFQSRLKGDELDARLCPKTAGPSSGLAILLDLSDPLEPVQQQRVRGFLEKRIAVAGQSTLIAVGAVLAGAGGENYSFARCKPMEGEDASEYYQNPRKVEERYQNEFRKPFESKLLSLMSSPVADQSPIMESLQKLLVSTPGFVDASYPRHVIIVSDLIQNSEAFSFYRGDTWSSFIESPDARRLAGRLRAVKVEICRVPRPGARVDMSRVDEFWIRYFDRAGASSILTSTCPLGDL